MANGTLPKEILLEELISSLGPRAIWHFDIDTKFLDHTRRPYPTGSKPIVRIGVFGSAYDSEQIRIFDDRRVEQLHTKGPTKILLEKAFDTGRELARQGQVIVTGACGGLPYEVVKAAKQYNPNTFVIGISPAKDEASHIARNMPVLLHDWIFYCGAQQNKIGSKLVQLEYLDPFDGFSFNDRDNRNVDVIHAALFLGGGSGSGHELFGSWEEGKAVALIKSSMDNSGPRGISNLIQPVLEDVMDYKNTGALFFSEQDPRLLVQRLIAQARVGMISQGDFKIGSVWVYRAKGEEVYVHTKEYEVSPDKKRIPDVTSPLKDRYLYPEYSVLTTNLGLPERIVGGFKLRPINDRDLEGELFEGPLKLLRSMRKYLHGIRKTSPEVIGGVEYRRAS